jgi:hypothetical protein
MTILGNRPMASFATRDPIADQREDSTALSVGVALHPDRQ